MGGWGDGAAVRSVGAGMQRGFLGVMIAIALATTGATAGRADTPPAPVPTPPAGCNPPSAGRVALWRGEGDARDSVAGLDGSLENGGGYRAGPVGQAFSLAGSDDHVRVADGPGLDQTGDLSLDAWVQIDDLNFGSPDPYGVGGDRIILWKVAADRYASYALWIEAEGTSAPVARLRFMHGDSALAGAVAESQDLTWSTDAWYHLAVTRRGREVSFYRDGEPVGGTTLAQDPVATPGAPLTIGGALVDTTVFNPLKGGVDETELWNRALTGEEVKALHDTGTGACATPPPPPADTTPPSVAITLSPADFGTDIHYSSALIAVGTDDPVATVRCVLDPSTVPNGFADLPTGPCPFRPSSSITAPLTQTALLTHTVYAAARDGAGNESARAFAQFGLRVPPQTYIEAGPPDGSTDAISEFVFTTRVIGAGPAAVPSPECRVDGGSWYDCGNPYSGVPCCKYRTRTAPLKAGKHRIEVRARDGLGIDPTPASTEWTIAAARPVVTRGSCSRSIPWYSYGEPAYQCEPLAATTCPLSSRCTFETQVTHVDDDPVNRERYEESPFSARSGYYAGPYLADPRAASYNGISAGTECYAGKPEGRSLDGYTHTCTQRTTYEYVTGADTVRIKDYCRGGRVVPNQGRPIFDRGSDDLRRMSCIASMTVTPVPSALGDALEGMSGANTAVLSVLAPGPGTLTTTATLGSRGFLAAAIPATPRRAAATTTVRVRKAGRVRVRLVLTKVARATLRRRHRLTMTVRYLFTRAGGPAIVRSRTLTLRVHPTRKAAR